MLTPLAIYHPLLALENQVYSFYVLSRETQGLDHHD